MITSPSCRCGSRELSRSEIDRLVERNGRLRVELARLEGELDAARAALAAKDSEIDRLRSELAGVRHQLEEARRAGKRQAAPFSKGDRTDPPCRKRPGRKAGDGYGRKAHRIPPEPERIDQTVTVGLPETCPHCGVGLAGVEPQRWLEQFQDELVAQILHRRYVIAAGRCPACQGSIRGRHVDQTSDAIGAAGAMLGPRALALSAWLHYGCGLSAAKISRLYGLLGLSVTPGGITLGWERLGRDATGTYEALKQALRASAVVTPDETGWRVDAERGWLWVFVGDTVTVYDIRVGDGSRGAEVATGMLGADFDGILCRDGWSAYRAFKSATHQTCLGHLLKRCREMIEDSVAGQARIPHAVRRLLKDALALRAAADCAQIGGKRLDEAIAALEARADRLIASRPTHEPNRRLIAHLARERHALFTFLRHPAAPATNHNAERAIRPQVCIRKNWGGNRSAAGAEAAKTIGSVIRTATQQGLDPTEVLVHLATTDGAQSGLSIPGRPGP